MLYEQHKGATNTLLGTAHDPFLRVRVIGFLLTRLLASLDDALQLGHPIYLIIEMVLSYCGWVILSTIAIINWLQEETDEK